VLLLLCLPALVFAQTLAVGASIPAFSVHDQHDKAHQMDRSVNVLLFSRDMDGGDVIKAALKGFSQQQLDEKHVVFLSDISAMPGFVASLFAKPKMRKLPWTMWLDEDGDVTAGLPSGKDKASLIFLHGLTITSIEITDQPERIRSALTGLSATKPTSGVSSD